MASGVMALCYENSPFETMSALKLNSYDQNFMIFGHIVKYHNVFFKFDNVPYRTSFLELLPFVY